MTKPRHSTGIEPEVLTKEKVAALLNMSHGTFARRESDLVKEGFPKRDPLLGGWNLRAVHRWLDARASGVRELPADDDERGKENWQNGDKQPRP